MSNTKISALTSGNPAQSSDQLPINRGGSNFSITAGSIASLSPTASGTLNTVAKFTGSSSLGNSGITDDGTTVSLTELFTQTLSDVTTGLIALNTMTLTLNPSATKTGTSAVLSIVQASSVTQPISGRMRGIIVAMSPSSSGTITRTEGINIGNFATGTSAFGTVIGGYFDTETLTTSGTTTTNEALLVQSGAAGSGGTITSDYGIRIPVPSKTGVLTHHYGIHFDSGHTGGANNADGWAIFIAGAADQSQFGIVQQLGLTTKYNNIATVSGGHPAEYATVDLTAQSAAIAANTIYAVPAAGAGMYRVSFVASITTASTSAGVLGGTNGFQIKYTDQNDSVVKTSSVNATTVSAANTTATTVSGTFIANCKASTNLQYSFDYTAGTGTALVYNIHVKVEAL